MCSAGHCCLGKWSLMWKKQMEESSSVIVQFSLIFRQYNSSLQPLNNEVPLKYPKWWLIWFKSSFSLFYLERKCLDIED